MSTRDISENIQEIYGFGVFAETISNITNRVLVDVKEWQSRALKPTYAVVFMDGMVFKVKKDGKFPRQRSLREDFRVILTEKITGSGAAPVRNSAKHMNYKELKEICDDLKKIYTAPNAEIGEQNLGEFSEKWDKKYGYISKSWRNNWEQLSTFWTYPDEIRTLIYTTNPIESFNRCLRKVTKNHPTFPSEDALSKSLFLGIRRLQKKWTTKVRNWGVGVVYTQLLIVFGQRIANQEL